MSTIETGHSYLNKEKLTKEEIEFVIAMVEKLKSEMSPETNLLPIMLFDEVENQVRSRSSEDAWKYVANYGREVEGLKTLFPKDWEIWNESDFVGQGFKLIEDIKEKILKNPDYSLTTKKDKITYKKDGKKFSISLYQRIEVFNPQTQKYEIRDFPSCEVLDLCVYLKKRERGLAITLLPESFAGQQERVFRLMGILRQSQDVILVLTKDNRVTKVFAPSTDTPEIQSKITEIQRILV